MTISMTTFSPDDLDALCSRREQVTVGYPDLRLPRGAATWGVGPVDLGRVPYVERGISDDSDDPEVADWFEHGTRYFASFAALPVRVSAAMAGVAVSSVTPSLGNELPERRAA